MFWETPLARRIAARFQGRGMAERVAARYAREFGSPEALKDYLHEHPQADKSKHTVTKKEEPKKKEEPSHKPKERKALFDPKETERLPDTAKQPDKDADKLFDHAKEAHDHQLKWLNQGKGLDKKIGATVVRGDKGELEIDLSKKGPIILIGPMKTKNRAQEKVDADYGGDWSRIGDVVRASVAVDSFDDIEGVLADLKKTGLKLARKPKDRFENPTDTGYRDVVLNVEYPNGHVGELQLHLKSILKAKEEGHKFYEEVRSIEAKAKKEGRKEMTEDEKKIVDEANRKAKDLYAKAWEKATTAKAAKVLTMPNGESITLTPEYLAQAAADGHGKVVCAGCATLISQCRCIAGHSIVRYGTCASCQKKAMTRTAAKRKYYEYDDLPAYWEGVKFPVLVTAKGEKTIYALQKFFTQATPISEKEFEALKKKL